MHLSLWHAIYSGIHSAEATATFMFLPSWKGSMITYPKSNLLTTYPYLCYKLCTIPANEVNYASPQSWTSRETPLPQASWNLHVIAVWNTAAQLHLNCHNPTWLQNLARDIPEAHWRLNSIANDPVHDAKHAERATGLKNFGRLHSKFTPPSANRDLL